MANKILSPTMLWNDFDDSLPVQCTVLGERAEEKIIFRRLRFFGRAVGNERVNIYALYAAPVKAENLPALLIMPDARRSADEDRLKTLSSSTAGRGKPMPPPS